MMVEKVSEKSCKSVFKHDDGERSEAFTSLWIKKNQKVKLTLPTLMFWIYNKSEILVCII